MVYSKQDLVDPLTLLSKLPAGELEGRKWARYVVLALEVCCRVPKRIKDVCLKIFLSFIYFIHHSFPRIVG